VSPTQLFGHSDDDDDIARRNSDISLHHAFQSLSEHLKKDSSGEATLHISDALPSAGDMLSTTALSVAGMGTAATKLQWVACTCTRTPTHRANNANNTHHPYAPRGSIAAGINFVDADGKCRQCECRVHTFYVFQFQAYATGMHQHRVSGVHTFPFECPHYSRASARTDEQ